MYPFLIDTATYIPPLAPADSLVDSDNQMPGDGITDTHKLRDGILSSSYVHMLSLGPPQMVSRVFQL